MPNFVAQKIYSCGKHCEKRRRNFSFSHNVFYPMWHLFSFQMHFKMLSAIYSNLDQYEILSSGNGIDKDKPVENKRCFFGGRQTQIIHAWIRTRCNSLNERLYLKNPGRIASL